MNMVLMLAALSLYGCARTLEVTAFVKDEVTGKPIANAQLDAYFHNDNGWEGWTRSAPEGRATAQTDSKGMCKLVGSSNKGEVSLAMWEAPRGYYRHLGVSLSFRNKKSMRREWLFTETSVTLSLQRVEHPIPLHVRHVQLNERKKGISGFDGTNIVLRYDFIVGDWLPPHGNGKHADMTANTHLKIGEALEIWRRHPTTFYDFVSTIEFNGEGNGLVEKMVDGKNLGIKIRDASEDGYVSKKAIRFGRAKRKQGPNTFPEYYAENNKDRCYCFRIRSRFDDKGRLIEAYYGKIYGDFNFDGYYDVGLRSVEFLYYLNPTPLGRNLEWDMKNNLCPKPGKIGQPQP